MRQDGRARIIRRLDAIVPVVTEGVRGAGIADLDQITRGIITAADRAQRRVGSADPQLRRLMVVSIVGEASQPTIAIGAAYQVTDSVVGISRLVAQRISGRDQP